MSNLDQALPQRNLRFVRNPLPGSLLVVPLLVIMFAIAGVIIWWQAPGLLHDAAVRANPVEIDDYQMRNAECTTHKGVFTDCKADVAYEVDGTRYERHIDLMFVSFSRGDFGTTLVVAADDPGKAALSLGLDHFWNRVLLLVCFAGVFVAVGVFGIVNGLRNARGNRSASEPQRWALEVVQVLNVQRIFRADQVTYGFLSAPGDRKRKAQSRFGRKQSPLFVESADDTVLALALRPASGGTPLLLDAELQRVDLTDSERRAALAVLGADEADAG